ncbi:hypothetical protein Y032_0041g490 [Ancylostoma ceylanicum]|uniref:Rho-GAP domain-containing protein n=1 Tax=Ancylostoma ceylanicum TaxID=53326 RepID=A0A016UIA9_9BILA|nr:hypothetical protein Y032_0041g490 [Ancylostoma ceylanicum]
MSAKPPVPKPRTRFNVGVVSCEASPSRSASHSATSSTDSSAVVDSNGNSDVRSDSIYPVVENLPPPEPLTIPTEVIAPATHRTAPPPPRPPPPKVPPPPPPVGWQIPPPVPQLPPIFLPSPPLPDARSQTSSSSVSSPSPPVPPRPKRWEPPKPVVNSHGDDGLYDIMPGDKKSDQSNLGAHRIDFIENPIYMSMFSMKKLSLASGDGKAESNYVTKELPPSPVKELPPSPVEPMECPVPVTESSSTEANDKTTNQPSSSDVSLLSEAPQCRLEATVPVPRPPLSSRNDAYEDRYTPTPRRSVAPSVDSFGTNSSPFDQFEKVIEVAEIPENISDTVELVNNDNEASSGDHANGTTVAYFGDVSLHIGKKERKKAHCRLRNMELSFHEDDTTEDCIAGPFSLLGCELICREEQTITIRLSERETSKVVVFTAEKDSETWILLLGECWLSEYDLLRSSVQQVHACGTFWLRQGATSDWMYTAAALHGRTMFYVLLDSPDYIYELDVRKVLLLRERLDKTDWCPKCKRKDQKGPFLISLEGCALYVECCDDLCTGKWFSAIQDSLSMSPSSVEDYRLTADNIPIIVDKCLRFVAAYGIRSEGIYRRNGKISEAKDIYRRLTEDPVRTHIASTSEETAYAVADVLRQFFRRLKSPLIPTSIHKEIYKLVDARNTCDSAIRYAEYRRVLQQMPLVHYHTLRKLMAHLSEVVKYCEVNKASVENVAKVFGPSLFHTEMKACFDDTTQQIGAIIDLINGYDVIFEVTSREEICRAMVEQAQLHKATTSNAVRADGLLVPIHVWERENRPFNVKIDLAAEEVCREAVARRGFDAPQDGNYAIFEVIMDGALSRRLTPFEKLSRTVLDHWLTWQCTDGYLLFDHDNWPYSDAELVGEFFSGKVKIAEPGSKTFHSYEMKVEEGVKIAAYKHDKLWKEWKVSDTIFYSGCCANRKAPNAYNVTVFDKKGVCVTDKFVGYCISFRLMPERTRFLNVVQFIETGGQPPPLVHL